jgi:hypothetical protein
MTKLEQMLLNGNNIAIVSVFYFMMALCKMPEWRKVSNILKSMLKQLPLESMLAIEELHMYQNDMAETFRFS